MKLCRRLGLAALTQSSDRVPDCPHISVFILSFIIDCALMWQDLYSVHCDALCTSHAASFSTWFLWKNFPQKKTNANEMGLKKKVSVKKPDGWTFDPLLQRCSRVERNSARHRWTATNGKSSLRSTCGDMFLQLEMVRTGRDKHICCSVVLHQIAFISDWTENKMNRSRRGVTSSARISRAAEVSAGDF